MAFNVFLFAVLISVGVMILADRYVTRSLRSYQFADIMLSRVMENLTKLTEGDLPVGAARISFMLASTAGCGCFVRAVLLSHYLPSSWASAIFGGVRQNPSPEFEHDLFDMDELSAEQGKHFSQLVASVIIYDGYRNPLSGWLFRRIVRAYAEPSYTDRERAEITTFSVLGRKVASHLPNFGEARPV